MAVLPFFHIYGMVVIMKLALAGGGTLVTMPRFDMMEFLGLVQKHRVTIRRWSRRSYSAWSSIPPSRSST